MHLYTILVDGTPTLAAADPDRPDDLFPLDRFGLAFSDMTDLIRHLSPAECTRLLAPENASGEPLHRADVTLCAPIPYPVQDILCLGVNYRDHAEESKRFHAKAFHKTEDAIYFAKRAAPATGDQGIIPSYPGLVDSLDYECELAVILAKDASNVAPEDAYSYIFGYTIMNDVSARNLQTARGQWYFGKSLDGFTPMGPCIVTADELPGAPALAIRSYVNGELRQNSCTDHLIHDIPDILSDLTRGITLRAGTIIATGTPAGVGMGFTPPRFLQSGDVVTCEIEKIGRLTSTVR